MNEPDLIEQARLFLPKYLSPAELKDLWEELKAFPNNRPYYSSHPSLRGRLLQGDGWRGFVVINFRTLERKTVSGVIISNSCDIDRNNTRALSPNLLFAPLVRLEGYFDLLRGAGQTQEQVESTYDAIRKQRITSIFYLPQAETLPESIVLLGDIHQHPLAEFTGDEGACRFRLGQFAFYLFLMKLSIHFTRMLEGIARSPPPPRRPP